MDIALRDMASAAYSVARREVFDLPGWTPMAVLTADQMWCVERLEWMNAAVRASRAA